jgi:hypothetical protein
VIDRKHLRINVVEAFRFSRYGKSSTPWAHA